MSDVLACLRDVLSAREVSGDAFITALDAFEDALDRHIDGRVENELRQYDLKFRSDDW